MIEELIEIGRMQPHRKAFALLWNRQAVQRLFVRIVQTVLENLRYAHALGFAGLMQRIGGFGRRGGIMRLSTQHDFCGRFRFLHGRRHWLIQCRLFFVGSLCRRLGCHIGLFCAAHRSGVLATDLAGDIRWCIRLFRFGRCWRDDRVGFSVWLFGAIFRNDLCSRFLQRLGCRAGLFCVAHRSGILAANLAGGIRWRGRLFRFGGCGR